MKAYDKENSVFCFQQLLVEINKIRSAFEAKSFDAIELVLMEEKEVLELLKISRTTLYKYNKKQMLLPQNFFGRKIYLRHEIYAEIINQLIKN